MKKHRKSRRRIITLRDLLPTGERLMEIAYTSTVEDPAAFSLGRHAGRNPDQPDTMGITKRMIRDRALAGDLGWFDAHEIWLRHDPFRWPPSRRTMVPKDDNNRKGDKRPIDSPAEIKRLVVLHVRDVLTDRLVSRLTDGQYGGRRRNDTPIYCKREGATSQDQVATAIHAAINDGYTWCVLIDLKDAFGRVPHQLCADELKKMRLDKDAIRLVWNLVRIHAVFRARPGWGKPITRKGMGIEQGNALSADLMNLVLAPVLRRIETRLDVRAFSYLDDIYLMCRSEADAHEAFKRFKATATGLGFDNVRPLWKPGREKKGKLSQVVDMAKVPIRVLKTYDVDGLGISLAPDKANQLRADIAKDGTFERMTINEVRRATGCQALTLQAMRARTDLMKRAPNTRSTRSPLGSCPPSTSLGGMNRSTVPPTGTTDVEPALPQGAGELPSPSGDGNPVEDTVVCNTTSDSFNGGSTSSTCTHGDEGEDHLLSLPVEPDEGVPPGGTRVVGDHHADEHQDHVAYLPRETGQRGSSLLDEADGLAVASQASKAGSVLLHQQEGSCTTEGPDTSRSRGRADGEDCPATLLLSDPEIQAALAARRGFQFGHKHKGSVLDLTGLADLDVPDHLLVEVVNGLIKAVRGRRRAVVVIDPGEPWTAARTDVLGGRDDRAYRLLDREVLPDGRRQLLLQPKATASRQASPRPTPPAGVDAVVVVRHVDRAMQVYELEVIEHGRRRRRRQDVDTPGPAGGSALAVAAWVASRKATVALPLSGRLKALAKALCTGQACAADIAFQDGALRLLGGRAWERAEGWAIGTPLDEPRPYAGNRQT